MRAMPDRESYKGFFGSHFVGSKIKFGGENPSAWTLVEKLSERHGQQDEFRYREAPADVSEAAALFACEKSDNGSTTGLMKIFMQCVSSSAFQAAQQLNRGPMNANGFWASEFRMKARSLNFRKSDGCRHPPGP
jgi:hypothetical protein